MRNGKKYILSHFGLDWNENDPIIVFCNAFERDQTNYLLNWLSKKGIERIPPTFRVCSFEALVSALLRRIGVGDFAHQSVREQLRRPVYTLQVKERCVYHDSLAIQYCSRAINHGFSLFLDGFVRERFIQILPNEYHFEQPRINVHSEQSISNTSVHSINDSLSSTIIRKNHGLQSLTQVHPEKVRNE